MRKIIIWVLAIILVITMLPLFAFAEEQPSIQSPGAFLMDMKSGEVLYAKNEHQKFYPASITKILTAIIALEQSKLDEQVRTSKLAREQEGNRVYLAEGEFQSMENLLYGLMLNSGNDAAIAIAEHISGSVEAFAELMNRKAKEIGALNSHFVNPNGLHDPEHYTTPYDMTLIGKYAMQNEKFREIVKTETRPWHGKEWESVLNNINPMLYNYEGVNGVKTGFTDQAKQTIVVSAVRGDRELIGTLMFADTRQMIRLDSTALLDYGFEKFTTRKIVDKEQFISTVPLGKEQQIGLKTAYEFYFTHAVKDNPDIQTRVQLNPQLKPPIAAGATVGSLEIVSAGKVIGSIPLISDKEVTVPPSFLQKLGVNISFSWWYTLLPAPLFLIGLIYRRARIRSMRQVHVQNFRDYRNQNYY
ncbi:Serine-type D-Ala-D-Ala carboxypeptidase [Effusibacillus lacus]|uniref:serine-type D-Ala-D-Ala carboxypeptidase n=1 Tax=Effusibacillus lacus TaxID=1348429 RepID=A0A292YTN6_9BACL|nr:Serine-type D-Ala-D-Ala carboxypeptidase [Effusibacillus lacus]